MAATVVADALVPAGVALLEVATDGSGATAFDGAHGTQLPTAERSSMLLPVSIPSVERGGRYPPLPVPRRPPRGLRNRRAGSVSVAWAPAEATDRRDWWSRTRWW